ncbi:hypothetical protein PP178_04240 [Zeaxanthinibacter sp. PT1]|uniref:hypothetical protein n=1 Tax=Zeaxanthinibacter TaxID=561554 RepID=UPI00234A3323|nr:hypothetical protein [Zeaxanthinibacter sp. PT1]MDC6350749.1 hypothetical protein [Zeaxanthinibacter sp. PT1]
MDHLTEAKEQYLSSMKENIMLHKDHLATLLQMPNAEGWETYDHRSEAVELAIGAVRNFIDNMEDEYLEATEQLDAPKPIN